VIRTLLLDLDGTLVDSAAGIIHTIAGVCAELGRPTPDDAAVRAVIGLPLRDAIATALVERDDARIDAAVASYRALYPALGRHAITVFPGIAAALDRQRARGVRLAIATAKHTDNAEEILRQVGLRDRIAAVYGAAAATDGKTAIVAAAMRSEGADPARTVMVGDRRDDMIAARAAGIAGWGVSWGYGSAEELLAAGAGRLLGDPTELGEPDGRPDASA
jgi:phosphoglycolate phosphatase